MALIMETVIITGEKTCVLVRYGGVVEADTDICPDIHGRTRPSVPSPLHTSNRQYQGQADTFTADNTRVSPPSTSFPSPYTVHSTVAL